jgi:hypothetical protein
MKYPYLYLPILCAAVLFCLPVLAKPGVNGDSIPSGQAAVALEGHAGSPKRDPRFDSDGFKLKFGPGGNQNFDAVFAAAPQPDGTLMPIAHTGHAARSAPNPQEQAGRC